MVNVEITPKAQEIIALILELENTHGGFRRYKVAVKLNRICLRNPQTVASLIFDDASILNEIRKERLLFQYSTDHWGSLRIRDNPRWADMMRSFVIPLMDTLPEEFQRQIKWHQETHGL
jgi:hypothetical protein